MELAQLTPELGHPSAGIELQSLQQTLPVSLISTPRALLKVCSQDQLVEEAVLSAANTGYDHLPVLSADDASEIVGVLSTKIESTGRVRDHCRPLTEHVLVGADASILDFALDAHRQPYRLVVAGARVDGIVTLWDLQKLPARAALFGLVTGLEMLLQKAICKEYSTSGWMAALTPGRRKKVQSALQEARESDAFVAEILYAEFADKLDIARKFTSLSKRNKEGMVKLRDNLAHASDYALTTELALKACSTLSEIVEFEKELASLTG